MKKTLTANISGTVFHIEEDAYETLQRYLGKVRSQFTGTDGRDEIMADIEARIAELFTERLAGVRQVISMSDVDHVIATMGQPEDYADGTEQEAEPGAAAGGSDAYTNKRKRLFRDPEDKWVGGVLGGVGAYFDVDPLIIRLIYLAFLFLGFGFILYLILWIILPSADTAAEKLQMRGEPVNVENIKRVFEEGAERVRTGASTMAQEAENIGRQAAPRIRRTGSEVAGFIGEALRLFLLAIGKIIGLAFIFAGAFLAIILIIILFAKFGTVRGGDNLFGAHGLHDMGLLFFDSPVQLTLTWLALIGLILAPMVGLLLGGVGLLFNTKSPKWIAWVLAPVWIASIAMLTVVGIRSGVQFSREEVVTTPLEITQPAGGTISLMAMHDPHFGDGHADDGIRMKLDGDQVVLGSAEVDIHESPDSLFHLVLERKAHASSLKEAARRATNIRYSMVQRDTIVQVAPWYGFSAHDRFRAQQVRYILQVPVGGKVYLDHSVEYMLDDVDNVTNTWDNDMVGKTWHMTTLGLEQVGREDASEGSSLEIRIEHKEAPNTTRRKGRTVRNSVETSVTVPTQQRIHLPDLLQLLRPRV